MQNSISIRTKRIT